MNERNLFSYYGVNLSEETEEINKAFWRDAQVQIKKIIRNDRTIWRVIQIEEKEEPYYVDFDNYEEAKESFNFWSSTLENKNVDLASIPEFQLRS
ncbi:hypothetical protein BKH42_08745 [Helicobacter sp. 13S00482-2]|uniref:hypothetical protein n=1 Tax=Helicobacter sp. 13S00482-2 TaxID=1476200 RepID=UPI000BA52BF5|nr:hypothetical protein [Helicobacter sp. 13S00482-2]PAF52923.1 hypothetical protein BKH42_08745 [Helicobacter sp. 13S00482-2]